MKLIKLKKQEREKLISEILDYALEYADTADAISELREYLKSGMRGFVPYKKQTDEQLLEEYLKTFDGRDLIETQCELDHNVLYENIWFITDTPNRAHKILSYLTHKATTQRGENAINRKNRGTREQKTSS